MGSVEADGNLVSSEPTEVLFLGHFGVQFRVTGQTLPALNFNFRTFGVLFGLIGV